MSQTLVASLQQTVLMCSSISRSGGTLLSCLVSKHCSLLSLHCDKFSMHIMYKVLYTTTLQELGGQANKKSKRGIPLPPTDALAWESPVWAQVTNSSVQLLEADKGQQKGLQSLFADLLPTAPVNTPFVFHDVHTGPSVCGSDMKPDVVMGLRDKPCNPLTTAAIIDFKRQGGGYDNDEHVSKAITYGRVFLQQLPRSLKSMVLVGLTDLCSITLILVRLVLSVEGAEELFFERSARLPDVRHTLLLLSCEPQR